MPFKHTTLLLAVALLCFACCAPTPAHATCQDCAAKGKSFYCPSNDKCFGDHPLCAIECREPCESTKACNGCYDSYNCTCGQCAENGYSYWCPLANECYRSLTTCAISCGSEADCFKTTYCAPPASCSAEQVTSCNSTQTCCLDDKGATFCSPYPNATCCQVGSLSCPIDYVCYPPTSACLPAPPSPPPHCNECKQVVQSIEDGMCDKCSTLFPALSWLCDLISKLGLCTWIEQKGLPPANVCEMIGFCGLEGCPCGYCRPQLYGQWCLSLPNKCPKTAEVGLRAADVAQPVFRTVGERDAHYGKAIRRAVGHLEAEKQRATFGAGNYCVDGVCDAANVGCCLTCA